MNYEIDITRRCNFSCPGCNHLCNIASDPSSDMTPEDVASVVSQINANDPSPGRIIVVGGEPTLHPKCVEYCRYIKDNVRSFSQLRLNTNFSHPGVSDSVASLGYDLADYLGSRDPAELRRIKANTHYNSLLSPREEGIPIDDPHNCFILRGLDGSGPCGMCVHRYRGRLWWCYCPNATSLAKLLGREDEFMFRTLADLLRSDKGRLCSEICVHCMSIARRQLLAKDTEGRVSRCFKKGLAAFRKYAGGRAGQVRRKKAGAGNTAACGGSAEAECTRPVPAVGASSTGASPLSEASRAEVAPPEASSPVASAKAGADIAMPRYSGFGRTCVVYVTDGNPDDAARLLWSLRSLVRHSSSAFDVAVLSNCPVGGVQVTSSCAGHAYFNVTDMYDTLCGVGMFRDRWNRRWPFEVLYRLGIPLSPRFSEYGRVLYLDTDTLALSPKVDRLLGADLRGFEAGGVYDIDGDCYGRIDRLLSSDLGQPHASEVLAWVGPSLLTRAYINAGVLLLNLDEIRGQMPWYRRRLEMFWEAECRCKFEYLDQDFVNSMMRVRTDFSTMFNWQRGGYPSDCVVRHYIKDQKADMQARAREDGLV